MVSPYEFFLVVAIEEIVLIKSALWKKDRNVKIYAINKGGSAKEKLHIDQLLFRPSWLNLHMNQIRNFLFESALLFSQFLHNPIYLYISLYISTNTNNGQVYIRVFLH